MKSELNVKDSLVRARNAYVVYTPKDCFGTIKFHERFGDTVVVGTLQGVQEIKIDTIRVSDVGYEVVEYYEPFPIGQWKILDTNLTLIKIIEW